MRGRGQFVADIQLPGMKNVAFLRSPVAHARIIDVTCPKHLRDRVHFHSNMLGVAPIRAVTGLTGFKVSEQHPLASGKVRHVGELIAMCVEDTRAEAEDTVTELDFEYDELPAVVDMLKAQHPDSPRIHDEWTDNVYLESCWEGDGRKFYF